MELRNRKLTNLNQMNQQQQQQLQQQIGMLNSRQNQQAARVNSGGAIQNLSSLYGKDAVGPAAPNYANMTQSALQAQPQQVKQQFHRQNYQLTSLGDASPAALGSGQTIIQGNLTSQKPQSLPPSQQFASPRKPLIATTADLNAKRQVQQTAKYSNNSMQHLQGPMQPTQQQIIEHVSYQQMDQRAFAVQHQQQLPSFQPKQAKGNTSQAKAVASALQAQQQQQQTSSQGGQKTGTTKKFKRSKRKMSNSPADIGAQQHDSLMRVTPGSRNEASAIHQQMMMTDEQQYKISDKGKLTQQQLPPNHSQQNRKMHPSSLDASQQQRLLQQTASSDADSVMKRQQRQQQQQQQQQSNTAPVNNSERKILVKDSNMHQVTLANFEELQRFLSSQGAAVKKLSANQLQQPPTSQASGQRFNDRNNKGSAHQQVILTPQPLIPQQILQMIQQQQAAQQQQAQMKGNQKRDSTHRPGEQQQQNVTVYYQPTSISMPMSLSVMDNFDAAGIHVNMQPTMNMHMVDMPGIQVMGQQHMTPQQTKIKNVQLKNATTLKQNGRHASEQAPQTSKTSKSMPNHPSAPTDVNLQQNNLIGSPTNASSKGTKKRSAQNSEQMPSHPAEMIQFNAQQLMNQMVNSPVMYKVTKKTEIIENMDIQPQYQFINQHDKSQLANEKSAQMQNTQKPMLLEMLRQDLPHIQNSANVHAAKSETKRSNRQYSKQQQQAPDTISHHSSVLLGSSSQQTRANNNPSGHMQTGTQQIQHIRQQPLQQPAPYGHLTQSPQTMMSPKATNKMYNQQETRMFQSHQQNIINGRIVKNSADLRGIQNDSTVQPKQQQSSFLPQLTGPSVSQQSPQTLPHVGHGLNGAMSPTLKKTRLSNAHVGSLVSAVTSGHEEVGRSDMGISMQKKRGRSLPRGASIADTSQRNTDKIAWQTNNELGGSTALPGVSQHISRTDEISTTKKMYIRRKTGNTDCNDDSMSRDDLIRTKKADDLPRTPMPVTKKQGDSPGFRQQNTQHMMHGDSSKKSIMVQELMSERPIHTESNVKNTMYTGQTQTQTPRNGSPYLGDDAHQHRISEMHKAEINNNAPNKSDFASPGNELKKTYSRQEKTDPQAVRKRRPDELTSDPSPQSHFLNQMESATNQYVTGPSDPGDTSTRSAIKQNNNQSKSEVRLSGSDEESLQVESVQVAKHQRTPKQMSSLPPRHLHQTQSQRQQQQLQMQQQQQLQMQQQQQQQQEQEPMMKYHTEEIDQQLFNGKQTPQMLDSNMPVSDLERIRFQETMPNQQHTVRIQIRSQKSREDISSPNRRRLNMTSRDPPEQQIVIRDVKGHEIQNGGKIIHLKVSAQQKPPQNAQIHDPNAANMFESFGKRQNSQNPVLGYIAQSPLNQSTYHQQNAQQQYQQVTQAQLQPVMQQSDMSQKRAGGGGQIVHHHQVMQSQTTTHQQMQQQHMQQQQMQQQHMQQQQQGKPPALQKVVGNSTPQRYHVSTHGSVQSNAKITVLNEQGTFHKHVLTSYCQTYMKKATVSNWTPKIYRNGLCKRLLVAKETLHKGRTCKPLLIVHIEGTLGYFDENKFFFCREKYLSYLSALSHNFRVIGLSTEPSKITKRLCHFMSHTLSAQRGFTFDAVYVIKKQMAGGKLNCSQLLLDMADDINEGNLEAFAASHCIILTADSKVDENLMKADLREIFHVDREYWTGTKAPLVIRVQHARIRPNNAFSFEAVFQLLICLLLSSSLDLSETDSMFSHNERTADLCIPSGDKNTFLQLLPEKIKFIDKIITRSTSQKFVFNLRTQKHGLHFHKGFKLLSEILVPLCKKNSKSSMLLHPLDQHKHPKIKLEWLELKVRLFKWPVPIKMKLEKITQKMLREALLPTGKAYSVICKTDEATKRFASYFKRNENVRKHIRKYRMRYWAYHQKDEDPLNPGLLEVSEIESQSHFGIDKQQQNNTTTDASISPQKPTKDDENKSKGLEDSSDEDAKSESSSDMEIAGYDAQALPIKYKVLEVRPPKDTPNAPGQDRDKATAVNANNANAANNQGNRLLKIDCRGPQQGNEKNAKEQKSLSQMLIEMCSKRQPPMMFQSTQAEHLKSAQNQQIESAVAELTAKLNEQGESKQQRIQDIKQKYD